MSDNSDDARQSTAVSKETALPPGYYLISGDYGQGNDEVTLLGLWDVLWKQRLLIFCIGAVFAVGSVAVALLLSPVYRSEAVLAPVEMEQGSALIEQFGGLASLAGVRLPGGGQSSTAIATLRSRAFAESFIEDHNLLPIFFEDKWDPIAEDWTGLAPEDVPTMYDAVEHFHENVFFVQEDVTSGLVTISVEWSDPQVATAWVNELVERINEETRQQVLVDAAKSLQYLRAQLEVAAVVQLQEAISRLIESEMQRDMLARVREEYAFTVIDPGMVPRRHVRPQRSLIVITSTFFGGVLAVVVALFRHSIRRQLAARAAAD